MKVYVHVDDTGKRPWFNCTNKMEEILSNKGLDAPYTTTTLYEATLVKVGTVEVQPTKRTLVLGK